MKCSFRQFLLLVLQVFLAVRVAHANPPGSVSRPAELEGEVRRLTELGQYSTALPLALHELNLRRDQPRRNMLAIAENLNRVSFLLRATGQYEGALQTSQEALRIVRSLRGHYHEIVALLITNIGATYSDMGRYEEAVRHYEQSIAIQRSRRQTDPAHLSTSLNNLAEAYQLIGQFERSLQIHREALRIRESIRPRNFALLATSYGNLANIFSRIGRGDLAEEFSARALESLARAYPPGHPIMAPRLNDIGEVLRRSGRLPQALEVLTRALRLKESSLPPTHPSISTTLNNIALTLSAMGRHEASLPYFQRAISIATGAFGPHHSATLVPLGNMALALVALHRIDEAVPLFERLLAGRASQFQGVSDFQGEGGLRGFLNAYSRVQRLLPHLAIQNPGNRRLREVALSAVMLFKARDEDELLTTILELRRDPTDAAQRLLSQWVGLRRSAVSSLQVSHAQAAHQQDALQAVEDQIAHAGAAARARRDFPTASALVPRVSGRLARDAALVEITSYTPFSALSADSRDDEPPRYAAFLLYSDGVSAVVDLGDATSLDAAARRLATTVSAPRRSPDSVVEAGRALGERVFTPLAAVLRPDIRRLVLAPDGPLHLTPLHLMHDGRMWLLDRYTVSYATSGRDLLRVRSPRDVLTVPTAVLATHYPVAEWNLTALAAQAEVLPRIVSNFRIIRDQDATEAALLGVSSPLILHVGAHGQFLDDTSPAAMRTAMQRGRLVLADAIPSLAERFDRSEGYATAAELLTANLSGTRLVVLSACDTAQGSVAAGDGVFGLRRALMLAGAEALITTQWSVDERAGVMFTIALYEGLRAGMRSADAVARAIHLVRQREPDPFAWAPFVLVGRDDVIDWDAVPAAPPANASGARTP